MPIRAEAARKLAHILVPKLVWSPRVIDSVAQTIMAYVNMDELRQEMEKKPKQPEARK